MDERCSDRADVLRLRALLALTDLELDALVLLERAVAAALDGLEVHENVRVTAVGGDEAEALLRVEPLDGALRHDMSPHGDGAVRALCPVRVASRRCVRPAHGDVSCEVTLRSPASEPSTNEVLQPR